MHVMEDEGRFAVRKRRTSTPPELSPGERGKKGCICHREKTAATSQGDEKDALVSRDQESHGRAQGEHIPFEPMSPPLFFAQNAQERVEKSKQTCNVSGCECTQIKAPRPRAARSSGWWDWRLLPPWLVKMRFCSISTAWVGVMAVPARNKSHMFSALSRAPNRFATLPDSLFLFLQERPRSRRKRRSPRRSRQRRLMGTKMVRAKTTTSSSSASTPSPSLSPQRS
jgi:hypothetical protein